MTAPPRGAVLVVGAVPGDGGGPARLSEPARRTVEALLPEGGVDDLDALLADARAKGRPGEVTVLSRPRQQPPAVLVAGVGDRSPAALRRAAAAAVRRAATVVPERGEAALALAGEFDDAAGTEPAAARAVVEGALLGGYRYSLASEPPQARLHQVCMVIDDRDPAVGEAVRRGLAAARGTALARDLVNTPSLDKAPAALADDITAAATAAGLSVRVREPDELARDGFGGILGVGMGSARGPRLVEVSYAPRGAGRHVLLVGKGITFDSGGLSLKPAESMVAMKTDMGGAAAVLGAVVAAAELGLRVKVTALLPLAENMPSGAAQRPGDVLRHWGGRTSEVLNTDAEGRLVLADALAYGTTRLRPDVVVDVATLTGAVSVALGRRTAGFYATTDELAAAVTAAADAAGEPVWRLPLAEDYRPLLDSDVADLRNVAVAGVGAGSIVAALYLREFTGGLPWAHLDIAGAARSEAAADELSKGGTGFATRTLLRLLESYAG